MIRLINVTAGYDKVEIIKNIDLFFEEGTINYYRQKRCGKTTLLKTASNLLKPFSGQITIKGKNISHIPNKELAKVIVFAPARIGTQYNSI